MAARRKQTFFERAVQSSSRHIRRILNSRKTKKKILLNKVTFRETLTGILLMIPSTATTMLTYYGISGPLAEQGGDIVQKGQALAFALTIGVFSWLGWFYLFGLIYRLRGTRVATALTAAVFYIGMIVGIDSPFNMLALGGAPAVQMTLVDTTVSYENRKDVVFNRATIAQRLLPAFKGQAQRFRDLEQSELKFGTFSGSSGAGKVSAGFAQIATLMETLIEELEIGLTTAKATQGNITTTLSAMKQATFRQGPIRPRVEVVSISADRMDDLLGALSQLDFTISITATLDSLKTIFPAPINARSEFEKVQNREIALITEMAQPVAESLQKALGELSSVKLPAAERIRPQDAITAIFTKWRELLPNWIAAIFIDVAPGALLIILIAAYREVETTGRTAARPSVVTSTTWPPTQKPPRKRKLKIEKEVENVTYLNDRNRSGNNTDHGDHDGHNGPDSA